MKHIRRMLALLLSMSMLLGFVSVARAVDNELTVKANNSTFTEVNGQVTLLFESVNDYKIDSQAGTNNGGNTSGGQTGESGDQTTPESTPDPEAKLRLSPVDANGLLVPAPEGDYGEAISVRIPLLCQRSSVYDLKITPVLSNDIEKFPFDIEAVDYMLTYPNSLQPGNIVEFTYNFRLSKKATTGVKQVDFNLSYRTGGDTWSGGANAGKLETATISIFVNVKKGLAPSTGDGEGAGSTPKLIVESYSISSDKIYAGETFDVTVTLRNTSSSEDIQNLQIGFKDTQEVAKLVPASGGSNTLYIKKIAKGDSVTEVISLPDRPGYRGQGLYPGSGLQLRRRIGQQGLYRRGDHCHPHFAEDPGEV